MSDRMDGGGDPPGEGARGASTTSFTAYASARERFLEQLRVDAEVRRLEGLWQLPAAPGDAPHEGEGS